MLCGCITGKSECICIEGKCDCAIKILEKEIVCGCITGKSECICIEGKCDCAIKQISVLEKNNCKCVFCTCKNCDC